MQRITVHSELSIYNRFDLNFSEGGTAGDHGDSSGAGAGDGVGGDNDGTGGMGNGGAASGQGDSGMGGYGGFGGLGIGNPGSYGGTSNVGAAGFGAGYGGSTAAGDLGGYGVGTNAGFAGNLTSTQHAANLANLEKEMGIDPDSFSVGYAISKSQGLVEGLMQATSPENVVGALTAGVVGVIGGKFGSTLAGAIGGSLFGPAGFLVGGYVGSKYGAQAAQELGADIMAGIRDGTVSSADDVASMANDIGMDGGRVAEEVAYNFGQAYDEYTGNGGSMATTSYEQKALDYLKQREKLPWQVSDEALKQLAGVQGIPGYEKQEKAFYKGIKSDPLYTNMMGSLDAGEDAILRHASATGGLRSGNVQDALATHASELEKQAYLDTYNARLGGLSGLAGLPSNAGQIAETYSTMGANQIAQQTANAQMSQDNMGMWLNAGLKGYELAGGWSGVKDIGSNIWSGLGEVGSWLGF